MDSVDIANHRTSKEIELEINSIRSKLTEYVSQDQIGICIDCGVKIPERRLRAIPNAVRCIKCQAKYEEELCSTR